MATVKEILQCIPPPVLYHYTTQQGLLGIIRDKEIWASHTQYLNDVREFSHALGIVKEELSAMIREASTNMVEREHLKVMEESVYEGMETVNVCVCSFSEQGDVLSQWRAYGGNTSGFAIGFSGTFLREMSSEHGWLVPVLYDEVQQRLLVRSLLGDALEENVKGEKFPAGRNLVEYLYRYAPILKHHSFVEEREWRIITRPIGRSNEHFGYRPGGSMLIPYFRLPLAKEKTLGIKDIVIGPTPHPEQSKNSVAGLCLKYDICELDKLFPEQPPSVTIRCSGIPYRSW